MKQPPPACYAPDLPEPGPLRPLILCERPAPACYARDPPRLVMRQTRPGPCFMRRPTPAGPRPGLQWDAPVQYIKGAGPKIAEILKKRSVFTVKDLIFWTPRGFQDNRVAENLISMPIGRPVVVIGRVQSKNIIPLPRSGKKLYEILIADGTAAVACKFFRPPYKNWFNSLRAGESVEIRGTAVIYRGRAEFHHPQIFPAKDREESADIDETASAFAPRLGAQTPKNFNAKKESETTLSPVAGPPATGAAAAKKTPQNLLLPLYTETEGLPQSKLRRIMGNLIESLSPARAAELEILPDWLRNKHRLLDLFSALKGLHQPDPKQIDAYLEFKTPFQERLIFDDFFELQLYLAQKGKRRLSERAEAISVDRAAVLKMKNTLPFHLTRAQEKVLEAVFRDLQQNRPMHRLLQGDVGCGKTLVALIAAFAVGKAGSQAAFMVPTEILAEQHYETAQRFLEPFGLKAVKLTGRQKAARKRESAAALQDGSAALCIGTHALLQETVNFHKLGLVIVDEQHRFGAGQRAVLKGKGASPHFLVMTATPIPRTLSMALFGDLDVSVIDELPPGRKPIVTRRVFPKKRSKVFEFLKAQVLEGRQAYVIYPLVEESEVLDLKNATDQYEKLKTIYNEFEWGLVTGRMSGEEKQAVMSRFRANKIQVLVSTTVIEVGVDVPNANLMIVEHSERFGLSQLHQLRGRVGRGPFQSYCALLLGDHFSPEAAERVYTMQQTSDGFKIAEKDLKLRGPGEILGERQSGLPGFKLAHIVRDARTLYKAKEAAKELISRDPTLSLPEHQKLKNAFEKTLQSVRPG